MRPTEGVICGAWGGEAVWGGSDCDGGDGELGLAGLLKQHAKKKYILPNKEKV